MLVVLDASILVAGFATRGSIPARIIDYWRHAAFRLAVSEPIIAEVSRAWQKRYYRSRIPADQADQAIALLRAKAIVTPITVDVKGIATHEADDQVLATAASARASFVVTGDRGLLRVTMYKDIAVVSPRQFLDLIVRLQE